jgi:hypothetical protein
VKDAFDFITGAVYDAGTRSLIVCDSRAHRHELTHSRSGPRLPSFLLVRADPSVLFMSDVKQSAGLIVEILAGCGEDGLVDGHCVHSMGRCLWGTPSFVQWTAFWGRIPSLILRRP